MFDLVIRNGYVVDGSGRRGAVQDLAVEDGKIAALGQIDGEAVDVVDSDGRVSPGFADIQERRSGCVRGTPGGSAAVRWGHRDRDGGAGLETSPAFAVMGYVR